MPVKNRAVAAAGVDAPPNGDAKHKTNENIKDSANNTVKQATVRPDNTDATGAHASPKKYKPYFYKTAQYRPYSILDSPEWKSSSFYGFYVLFWIVVGMTNVRLLIGNYLETGRFLEHHVIDILRDNLWHVALTDLVMYLLMYPTYFLQKAVANGYIHWNKYGWILQHIYQTTYLYLSLRYAQANNFTWIAQIFLTLHALVQMMKMHSFAVFNGSMNTLRTKIHHDKIDKEIMAEAKKELDSYPSNLTLSNFFMYTMYPTVVYEVDYPRTEKIRWTYVFRKVAATLGVFVLMIVIGQQKIHPVAVHANILRQNSSLWFRIRMYPLIFMEVFTPFVMLWLLTFYIIWDAILNSIAELTRFGDREFYRDWWNSTEWAKFARDWNVPVHNFLQRHVYTSSRLSLKLSKQQAMFFTFFFSACVHELAMYVIFGRWRGYLFFTQLTQLPMQFLSQFKFFKSRPTLGLVLFWVGVALGPSVVCSMYLTL